MKNPDRVYYYLHDTKVNYDGNDCAWLDGEGGTTYDLRKAHLHSRDGTFELLNENKRLQAYPVHKIVRLIQLHVPLSAIKKCKPVHGEKCYLICTRDTCGKNAAFWGWNNRGYTSEIRAAQVFTYDVNKSETDRKIDVMVPARVVQDKAEFRIDMQDLGPNSINNKLPHTMDKEFFEEA